MNPICEAKIINTDETVVEPEQQWIVIISKNQTSAERSCAEPFLIEGTTIINHINCSIFIEGTKYDDSELFCEERIKLSLPETKNILINTTMEDLSLNKIILHLQEYKTKILQVKESTIDLRFLTYASSVILVIFILYALVVKRNITYLPNHTPSVNYVSSIPSLWPSLHSRGGGVVPPQQYLHLLPRPQNLYAKTVSSLSSLLTTSAVYVFSAVSLKPSHQSC